MKTGRVEVVTNAMARELITDASGKVTAVSYIDKTTGRRAAGAVPGGRAVRVGVRVGASAAQLEVVPASERPGQCQRHRRQVPDRLGRVRHVRERASPRRHAGPQRRRLRRAPLYPVVDVGSAQGTEFRARVSRRGRRRRIRHAGPRASARRVQAERRLRAADEAGHSRVVRRARRSASAAAAR